MLSEQEAGKIKKQIISQIDTWNANEEQKQQAKEQIQNLTAKQLEEFLSKNLKKQECVFCSINQNKTPSYKILENEKAVAVLEINPLSLGHALIIPKKHEGEPDKDLAEKVAAIIKSKLKPKEVKIEKSEAGHKVISLIPVYDSKLKRKQASEEELKNLQELLTKVEEKPKQQPPTEQPKPMKLEKAPRRIP